MTGVQTCALPIYGCVDRLARMGAELVVTDFLFLFEPPDVVGETLASDKAGIVFFVIDLLFVN